MPHTQEEYARTAELRARSLNQAFARLSPKRRLVLAEIVNGLRGTEIAQKLNCSASTINGHKKSIYRKLGVNNLTAAAVVAVIYGGFKPERHLDDDLKQGLADLNNVDREVLMWLATGLTNREIAEKKKCSRHTVESRVRRRIFGKLGVKTRRHAAVLGVVYGGIKPDLDAILRDLY